MGQTDNATANADAGGGHMEMQGVQLYPEINSLTGRGEALPEAPRCHASLSCVLTGVCGDRPLCTVEYPIGGDMAFVAEGSKCCKYHFEFGGGHVCNCPVRMALYRLSHSDNR